MVYALIGKDVRYRPGFRDHKIMLDSSLVYSSKPEGSIPLKAGRYAEPASREQGNFSARKINITGLFPDIL